MPRTLSSDRSGRKSRSASKKRKRSRRDASESSDSTSVSSASSSSSCSSSSTNSSESDSKSRQRSKDKTSNKSRKRSSSSKKIKKRQRSSSLSSSSCSPVRKKKKKKDTKKKKKKEKKKKKKKKRKAEKKIAAISILKESSVGLVTPNAVLSQPLQGSVKKKSEKSIGPLPRVMKPMTKEEWDKRQSVTRHVYDEETGRTRLIKGDGEVLEEIVTRDRHKEVNKMSTEGDGRFFASKMGLQ